MSDDIKELLGRAFGEEPPLRIDRDEVFHQGRKRLRKRRFLEAGSVVAAVVVTVVGAAMFTHLGGAEPERMPPAASYPRPTPREGPELPLTAAASPTTGPVETAPPSMIAGAEVAGQLTQALYSSGILLENEIEPLPGTSDLPQFQQYDTQYVYEADVVRANSQGYLHIAVDYGPGTVASCDAVPEPFGDCELRREGAEPVTYAYYAGLDGEQRVYVSVVLTNGTQLAATASNYTIRDRDSGIKPEPKVPPVLNSDELAALLTKAGLGVS